MTSLGLVMGNATALALSGAGRAAGTASAVLGAAQFAVAACVAPLVGLAGPGAVVPMAAAMGTSTALALAALLIAGRTADPRRG